MAAPDAIAERLHRLYIDELLQSLMPLVHRMVHERQTQALIRRARNYGPGVCEAPDATTWIWSDLHLGHKASVEAFWRPFRTPHDMDKAMMDAWYEMVNVDDTIVCLGDVGVDGSVQPHHQRWWREAPGAKWIVLGNHEHNHGIITHVHARSSTLTHAFSPHKLACTRGLTFRKIRSAAVILGCPIPLTVVWSWYGKTDSQAGRRATKTRPVR